MATQHLSRQGVNATGCPIARPSRRDLLGAAGFTALTGIAVAAIARPDAQAVEGISPASGGDVALIAACDRFMVLQAGLYASYAKEREQHDALKKQGVLYRQLQAFEMEVEAERTPLQDEQVELLDQIEDLEASTLAGQRARARVLMAWYEVGNGGEHHVVLEWHRLAPLFRDLLGEAV